jgi:hypothetical protein
MSNFGSRTVGTVGTKSYVKTVVASYESLIMTKVDEKSFHFMQWFSIYVTFRN